MTCLRRLIWQKVLAMKARPGTVAALGEQAMDASGLPGSNPLRIMRPFDVDRMCDTENQGESRGFAMLAVTVDWNLLKQLGGTLAPWQWAITLVMSCVGVWSIFQLRAWFREDTGRADDNLEMLTQFRDLHRQGGLSEDEYRLIKSRLVAGHGSQSNAGQRSPTSAKTAAGPQTANGKDGPHDGTNGESRSSEKPPTMEAETRNTTGSEHTTKDGSGKNLDDSH